MAANSGKQTFVVFARKQYEQPLTEVGSIEAQSGQQAHKEALKAFPADDWLEMIAVPQSVVIPVISGSHMAKERDYE